MGASVQAALWMIGAIFSFTAMAVAGRAVSFELDTFEIMLYRSLLGIVVVLIVARAAGTLGEVRRERLGLHAVRNLAHFFGQNCWFYALTVIPLAQLFALEFTSPLWVLILAPIFLGERLTRAKLGYATLGFVGVLIVARPDVTNLNPGIVI
ncbi:MAG: DMT family transporter, partial [Pseudomonadota bacterium]